MTGTTRELAATAMALKARHGELLAGEDAIAETAEQLAAVAAVEVAQARLRGERPARTRAIAEAQQLVDAGQISLFGAVCLVDVLEAEHADTALDSRA